MALWADQLAGRLAERWAGRPAGRRALAVGYDMPAGALAGDQTSWRADWLVSGPAVGRPVRRTDEWADGLYLTAVVYYNSSMNKFTLLCCFT